MSLVVSTTSTKEITPVYILSIAGNRQLRKPQCHGGNECVGNYKPDTPRVPKRNSLSSGLTKLLPNKYHRLISNVIVVNKSVIQTDTIVYNQRPGCSRTSEYILKETKWIQSRICLDKETGCRSPANEQRVKDHH